ncbi:MDR/zinc-dependent alcohol dehydrogenase-like family protein [Micromonospora matsumotoense]|uniref:MDR/zinc-dependent alcohol dehydrogenase-like family protein n=1 Tax=Micromonospora matsumotoense TaxID=121616 RepID=UPI003D91C54E
MRVVVADQHTDLPAPAGWSEHAVVPVDGVPTRFGMAHVPRTAFDPTADYNRDHVLLRLKAFALGRWRDLLTRRHDDVLGPHRGLGVDFVAEVVATGTNVTRFQPGQRVIPCPDWPADTGAPGTRGLVTCTASREYARLPAASLICVGSAIGDKAAAALSASASTGFALVRRADPSRGSRVLVCGGASGTSLATVAALVNRGLRPALHGVPRRHLRRVDQLGIADLVDPDGTSFAQAHRLAREVGGFATVIDVSGTTQGIRSAVALLGLGGSYLTCTPPAGGGADDYADVLHRLVIRGASLTGVHLGTRADLVEALRWADESGWRPAVDDVYTDGDLATFVEHQFGEFPRFGDAVFTYSDSGA